MVEVIILFQDGKYPFNKHSQSNQNNANHNKVYMQYLLELKQQQLHQHYRKVNSIYKSLQCQYIVKLSKILKQDHKYHMMYQYYSKSLSSRLKQLVTEEEFMNIFIELEIVFDTLIKAMLKATISIDFIAIDEMNKLKVWIKPQDIQFLQTDQSNHPVKMTLNQYYQTQRKRLHLEIEEIFQTNNEIFKNKIQEKSQQESKNNEQNKGQNKLKSPNFVIQGNTLVFINNKTKDKFKQFSKEGHQTKQSKELNQLEKIKKFIQKNKQPKQTRQETKSKQIKNSSQQKEVLINQQHNSRKQIIDINKMTIAQKVLYYKKHQQNLSNQSQTSNKVIIKDNSTGNASQNDISKSSDNDSKIICFRNQFINSKHEIQPNNKKQIQANNKNQFQQNFRNQNQNNKQKIQENNKLSHEIKFLESNKQINKESSYHFKNNDSSVHSSHGDKYIKSLELDLENSLQHKSQQANKIKYDEKKNKSIQNILPTQTQTINTQENKQSINRSDKIIQNDKILQAKQKAKNILEKYAEKNKK